MKIAVGSDHAGYEDPPPYYKPEIVRHIEALGHEVVDCGTNSSDSVDYPDFADRVAQAVTSGKADLGILVCGTGIGMAIKANRQKGVRAAVCTSPEMARLSREHNNANVLCVGKRILSLDQILNIVDTWFETPFSEGERHTRRVNKMD